MAQTRKPKPPERRPWHPVSWEKPEIAAVQALERGDANPEQQRTALNWIIMVAAGTYEETYYPDARDSDFAQGRRFVGLQIVKMLKLALSRLT